MQKKELKLKKVTIGGLENHDMLNDAVFDDNLVETVEWMSEDCNSLNTVNFAKTKINSLESHMFKNCDTLTEVFLSETLKEIKEFAFDGCCNLKRVYFAKNCVKCDYLKNFHVGECTNNDIVCKIHSDGLLILPCDIKYVGDYAFKNCHNIKKVRYFSDSTELSPLAFEKM